MKKTNTLTLRTTGLCAFAILAFGCIEQKTAVDEPTDRTLTVTSIPSPAKANSGEPNLCSTSDGGCLFSWIETDTTANTHSLMYSRYSNSSWSEPQQIATGDNWFVNWADFPAMAELSNGGMMASWLTKSAASTYAYDVTMAVSNNYGASWSESFVPHDDGTPTEHGFVSILALDGGSFAACWLDGRQTVEKTGTMTLRYGTVSRDGTVSDGVVLDEKVCDCCQTAMTVAGDGSLLVAYRDRSDDEIRDISIVRRTGSEWSDPISVSNDGWHIEGCPVNGPALASSDSLVAASWFTLGSNDSGLVLCAFSSDFGKTFAKPIRIDTGKPIGRVDILFVEDDVALVSWLEHVGDTARVAVRTVKPAGVVSEVVTVTQSSSSRLSGFARMALTSEGVVISWTDTDELPKVETARIIVQ